MKPPHSANGVILFSHATSLYLHGSAARPSSTTTHAQSENLFSYSVVNQLSKLLQSCVSHFFPFTQSCSDSDTISVSTRVEAPFTSQLHQPGQLHQCGYSRTGAARILNKNSSMTNKLCTCVVRTCVSDVQVYHYFKTHFNNLESRFSFAVFIHVLQRI